MSAVLWIVIGVCMMTVGVVGFIVSQTLIGRWVKSPKISDINRRG